MGFFCEYTQTERREFSALFLPSNSLFLVTSKS